MKKIFTVLMALGIALCTVANPTFSVAEKLDISKVKTPKMEKSFTPVEKTSKAVRMDKQEARQAMVEARQAKTVAPVAVKGVRQIEAMPVAEKQALPVVNNKQRAAAQATAATDTVEIVGYEWTYEYYSDTKDWYMAVIDASQTYVVRLDYLVAEEDFAGTYNIDNLDLNYSYLTIYDEDRNKTYVNYVEADFTVSVTEEGKFLTANLLCENGIRYLVSAEELPLPEPIGNVDLAYTNATLEDGTRSSETFQFWADENGVYTSFLIASDEVVGEYTQDDMYVAYANYIMFVDGTDTTFVDFLGFDMAITKEGQTYNLVADALGSDTIMYHITMSYTKPAPTDTIDIVATNMTIDEFEFIGMYFCTITASNDEYTVTLDMANGLPLGELTSADFNVEWSSVYRIADSTEIVFDDILSATVTEVDGQRAIKAQALGVDTILYNLDLSYVLPEAKDTVAIEFTTPASAEYYDSEGDYYIYNENEEYIVTLDIYAEKNALEGEYEGEDFYLYYTQVGLIVDGDTTGVAVAAAKAIATKVSDDLVHIDAELLCENEVLYLVSTDVDVSNKGLTYDATEGSLEDEYTTEDLYTITDYSNYGLIYFDAEAADGTDLMGLQFWVDGTDENTTIPVGTYPINDSMEPGTVMASAGMTADGLTYSLYATMENGTIVSPCWFMVDGEVVVSEENGILSITVDAINSNNLPIYITCEYDLKPEYALEETVEISNLTTDILTVGEATYLQLTGRNDMLDSDVQLFLNNYTGEDKEYEVNVENSLMTFGGLELTVVEGKIAQATDPEKGQVYTGRVIASVEEEGEVMLVALDLVMYATPPVELEIIDAVASVDEATGALVLTAEWTDTVSMVTYPVSIAVAGYNEADLDENGFVEYEGAQISELQIGGDGDDDPWLDYAVANAVAVIKDGNVVTIEAEYTSWNTGATYYVYAEGVMQGGEDPEYMVIEDEITNLVIDLESMAIIGGPSTKWQVDVFLGLAEDDNMDGQWSLSPESSVAIMGFDARLIDGYVYDIDVNAPAAKAVLYVEDSGFFYEIKLNMTSTPTEAIVVVVEDATIQIDTIPLFGDAVDYALKMTADWTYAEDGVTYPVLVEVPVYYPEATEPSEITCTVTIGGMGDDDPWLGFGEGTLTITTEGGVVTAKGIVANPYTGVAFDVTVSGKLPQGPGTGIDNVQVEVKTVKMIQNGQLIINRNGKAYNAIGVQVK